MRATASTSINFGVINVPVQLFKATKSNDVRFNMCAPDGSPVEQVYRKKGTEEIVGTAKDCGKAIDGFQIDPDVVKAIDSECKLEDGKDLKKLNISSFIPLDKVPFNRVTNWYYVGNDPKNGNPEALATIVKAMEQKNLAAVTKWVPKTRQEMLVLFVQDGLLYAVAVSFAADIQEAPATVTDVAKFKAEDEVVEAASAFIDMKVDESAADLDTMQDGAVAKRMELVEAVKQGEAIEVTTVVEEPTAGEDLMAKLKASIDAEAVAS